MVLPKSTRTSIVRPLVVVTIDSFCTHLGLYCAVRIGNCLFITKVLKYLKAWYFHQKHPNLLYTLVQWQIGLFYDRSYKYVFIFLISEFNMRVRNTYFNVYYLMDSRYNDLPYNRVLCSEWTLARIKTNNYLNIFWNCCPHGTPFTNRVDI